MVLSIEFHSNKKQENIMIRKIKLQQGILMAIISVLVAGCQLSAPMATPTLDTNEIQNIQVQTANPEKSSGVSEDFPLPNCGGTGKLAQTLGTQVSVSKTIEMGSTVSVSGGVRLAFRQLLRLICRRLSKRLINNSMKQLILD